MLLAISKTGWESLPARERNIMRWAADKVALGTPAIYVNRVTQARWYVFSHPALTYNMLAWFGCIAANASEIANLQGINPENSEAFRFALRAWLKNPSRTHPHVPAADVPGETTPQDILDANGAPAALRAKTGGPPDDETLWDPYDPTLHGGL